MTILIGFMGAGKTSVGRALAVRLQLPFLDLDDRLTERFGCPIPEVFARRGEAAFRAAEAEELERLLDRPSPMVLAAGGGIVETPSVRDSLARCPAVIWLHPPFRTLLERIRAQAGGRPLADGRSAPEIRALWRRRLPWYRKAARLVIRQVAPSPDLLAHMIHSHPDFPA